MTADGDEHDVWPISVQRGHSATTLFILSAVTLILDRIQRLPPFFVTTVYQYRISASSFWAPVGLTTRTLKFSRQRKIGKLRSNRPLPGLNWILYKATHTRRLMLEIVQMYTQWDSCLCCVVCTMRSVSLCVFYSRRLSTCGETLMRWKWSYEQQVNHRSKPINKPTNHPTRISFSNVPLSRDPHSSAFVGSY